MVATTALTLRSFLIPFATHLRARGWLVHGIAADAEACNACRAAFDHVHNVGWSRSPRDLAGLLAGYRAVRKLADRWRFDLVHVHTPVAGLLTRIALRGSRPGTRVIYTAHGFHFHESGSALGNALFGMIERIAGRWTDRLIVINQDDERAALERRIVPRTRLLRMPGIGVDVEAFASQAGPARVSGFPDGAGGVINGPVFLSVAEFNPGKRHRDLVRALSLLQRTDVHLAFAGVGPESERVRQLARTLGLRDRVHLLGYRRDVAELLRAATSFVLCSEREGLPRSVMEAMAAGTPVIGTRIRGMRDLLGDSAGLLVPVGDAAQIAAAMRTVLGDQALVRRMVDNARRRIAEFSLERVIAMHDALYDDLLRESGA